MSTRIAVFGLLLISTDLLPAQEPTIDICFGETQNVSFTSDDPEGVHEYKWFMNEGSGFDLFSERRNVNLSADDNDGNLIYGMEITDECQVIVSDTFRIQRLGINTTNIDDVFNLYFSPYINGPSAISIKPEYAYLIDGDHYASTDSLWVTLGSMAIQIDSDSINFDMPLSAFREPFLIQSDTIRELSYRIRALWDECNQVFFTNPRISYDKSNFISTSEDRSGRFFISGLLDTLQAGQNLSNMVGVYSNESKNLTTIAKMRPVNNPFLEITEALVAADSLNLIEEYYFGLEDSASTPASLPTGKYQILIEGYDNVTEERIYYDSTIKYYENNNPDIYGLADLNPIQNPYMGDPEHTLEMTYYSSPILRFVNAKLEYFFLSEDHQDTLRNRNQFSLPYTDASDTTVFNIELVTSTDDYQYDTVYFEFIDSLDNHVFILPAATNLSEDIIRSSNAYFAQFDDQGNELEGYIIGDSTFSDSDVSFIVNFSFPQSEVFTRSIQSQHPDSVLGSFYTLSRLDSIYLEFDLGLDYEHFYGSNLNSDSTGLEWEMELYVDYVAALNIQPTEKIEGTKTVATYSGSLPFEYDENGESSSIVDVKILKSTITEYDPLDDAPGSTKLNYTTSKEEFFINFYLKGDSVDNILDLKSDFSISDTLKFAIVEDEIIYGDIDLGFVYDYPFEQRFDIRGNRTSSGYVERYPIYLWNDQHNSHRLFTFTAPDPSPRINEPRFYDKFNYEADLNFEFADSLSNVEVAIYSTTQEFNDLVLDMVGKNPRMYFYGQEFDNLGPGFLDRVLEMVKGNGGGNFLKNFHKNENYFKLEKIDILDNLNNYRANPEFNIDVMYDTLDYDPNKRSYIFVIDPNNKVLETNEENNIYFHNIHEYCDTGVDLTIPEPTSSFYSADDDTEYRSFEVTVRDYKLMDDTQRNSVSSVDGLVKINDGEKITVQVIVRNNGTLPSNVAELKLKAFPIAPALPDSIRLIRSDEDFQRYWDRSVEVGTFPISAFTNYVGSGMDYRNDINGGLVQVPMGEVLQLELDPSTFIPPGNTFFLLADLVSEEDCINGVNDRTWGRKGFEPSGYRNKRTYSLQKFVVGSPCVILDNFEYPDFTDVQCGSEFPIRFDVVNIEQGFSSSNDFYLYFEDNLGNQDTITFNGIGAGESIPVGMRQEIVLPADDFVKTDENGRFYSLRRQAEFDYQVDLTLDLRNINVPDTIKNYILQDEMNVIVRRGTIEPPLVHTNNGRRMAWRSTGKGATYYYDISYQPMAPTGNAMRITGSTNSNSVDIESRGFPFEYGTYRIKIYAEDDYCGWSEETTSKFEYSPPPPPSKLSGGSRGGGGGSGGGGSGVSCDASGCISNISPSCVIVDSRYDEKSRKLWFRYQNIYNKKVEARVCIEGDCGKTTIRPGDTKTWWSYGVPENAGVSIQFDFCRNN